MDARQTPASLEPAKDALHAEPATGAHDDTRSAQSTRRGSVGVYDRPESAPRSWSSVITALVVIALILAVLVYFFVR
jgi:hypothetical protein